MRRPGRRRKERAQRRKSESQPENEFATLNTAIFHFDITFICLYDPYLCWITADCSSWSQCCISTRWDLSPPHSSPSLRSCQTDVPVSCRRPGGGDHDGIEKLLPVQSVSENSKSSTGCDALFCTFQNKAQIMLWFPYQNKTEHNHLNSRKISLHAGDQILGHLV